jgi:hypothetical protein
MWRLWSKPLELLGRLGVGRIPTRKMRVGHPSALDGRGSMHWRDYARAERLYDVWGPAPDGPWVPFHCVPLFAALDRIPEDLMGPTPPVPAVDPALAAPAQLRGLPPHARPGALAPGWLAADTWTLLDLPGVLAVEAGAWLVAAGGCQPVCTFDNWPHPRGVLRAEEVLAELLRWATTVAEARPRLRSDSPPLWICDRGRLGERPGRPGELDNRYYLDDSILPGAGLLQQSGIRRVVYVTLAAGDVPVADVEPYLAELQTAGLEVLRVNLDDPALAPLPFIPPKKTGARPTGFRRSAAGGFGTIVPEPSSSGS